MKTALKTSLLTILALVAISGTAQAQDSSSNTTSQVSTAVEASTTPTAERTVPTDEEIRKMDIWQACKALGVSPDYNKRYEHIILPLCEAGVIMFDASSNRYADESDEKEMGVLDPTSGRYIAKDQSGKTIYLDCYYYTGTGAQNATLIRNMVANKHLIKNGKLVPGAAAKWKVVK